MSQIPTPALLERVHALMPDLEIADFERNQEGLINDILIVNHSLVFRFAKTEEYARMLQTELRLLDLLRAQIAIQVPEPLLRGPDYMVYPYLPGRPLLRRTLVNAPESVQVDFARQLGVFLYRLHNLDVASVTGLAQPNPAPVKRDNWLKYFETIQAKMYPLLLPHQVDWVEALFRPLQENERFFEFEPALIHGDLGCYHILCDPAQAAIRAVIDFGMAGLGDPASDLGTLMNVYGERFLRRMQPTYPELGRFLSRACFYAQAVELEWVMNGLQSGETFWFTAHLAAARDLDA